ncbi:MAG TPA: apolipoprotein N-acyltransferase [Acidimicrobiales bacterium]|nr:apolipoprotein N-acyltransferase [Acidimicrobiales bacterium]
MERPRRDLAAGAGAVGAGLLVAASMPPWGWWPLAFAGIAILDRLVAGRSRRSRATRAFLFGLGWFAAGMVWMLSFTIPGYLAAIAVYAGYLAAATAIAPAGRWRWLGLPAALTLAEALRFCFPFGGVPLASLGIAQVAGPLATPARLGGVLLITWLTFQIGCGLSALFERRLLPAAVAAGLMLTALLAAAIAPSGEDTGRTIRMALVQGGGEQGTSALEVPPELVFQRHLAATATIEDPVDVVVWPENIVDVNDLLFAESAEREAIAAEAARLQAPILVGVTEDVGDRFLNAQVVIAPDGEITDRYEKVRRVPFGEYLPLRGLLEAINAPGIDQLGRDAVAGTGPAVLELPDGTRLGVAISWEIFFGGRVRDGVEAGGEIVTNPTNGASYEGTIVQTQQVAASRLRALETGRWVAQVSPTGFSAFVSPSGDVHHRTTITEQEVIRRDVPMRTGRTWYVRLGELPWVAVFALVLSGALLLTRRDRRPPAPA